MLTYTYREKHKTNAQTELLKTQTQSDNMKSNTSNVKKKCSNKYRQIFFKSTIDFVLYWSSTARHEACILVCILVI